MKKNMNTLSHPSAHAGFTLTEMIITLAVAAVLMTVGIPNLRTFLLQQNIEARTNDVITALNHARGQAISRANNAGVTIAAYDPSTKNWSSGWLLCQDNNNDKACTDTDDIIAQNNFNDNTTIKSTTVGSFRYLSNGMIDKPNGVVFHVCNMSIPNRGQEIKVTRTGRPSITNTSFQCTSG
jgi:type IV fimbrial biogenesis protein FimT